MRHIWNVFFLNLMYVHATATCISYMNSYLSNLHLIQCVLVGGFSMGPLTKHRHKQLDNGDQVAIFAVQDQVSVTAGDDSDEAKEKLTLGLLHVSQSFEPRMFERNYLICFLYRRQTTLNDYLCYR